MFGFPLSSLQWWILDDSDGQPITTQSFIGIIVAICGNVVISLALNCQKLAHRRLERERQSKNLSRDVTPKHGNAEQTQRLSDIGEESEPLLGAIESSRYDGMSPDAALKSIPPLLVPVKSPHSPPKLTRRMSMGSGRGTVSPYNSSDNTTAPEPLIPIALADVRSPNTCRTGTPQEDLEPGRDNTGVSTGEDDDDWNEDSKGGAEYLKSKLWWFGFLLMNIGEIGNFLSYGFAPASVVAPLGAFALIANCFFAPIMLHERFTKRDLFGMLLAIAGAATVVSSAKPSSPHLDPSRLIQALTQLSFIIYAIVVVICGCVLVFVSEKRWGRQWILVDVSICALFGGFTVLCTKAISTLLSIEWVGIFKEWITYPIILILVATGVGQIWYLNRALMNFDSKQVIPTQFVLFNLSAIVGSAILYGEFYRVNFHQFVTFLYGCGATFGGVYLLTTATGGASERLHSQDRGFNRLTVIPEESYGGARSPLKTPPISIPKRKKSTAGIGLSPGQYLLLAAPVLTSGGPSNAQTRSLERRYSSAGSQPRSPERPSSLYQW